jgi:diguanylate cyclase (GGDEF)-like protein
MRSLRWHRRRSPEAQGPGPRLRYLLLFAVGFLCLDAACSQSPQLFAMGVNYIFQISAPLLALAACIWRARSIVGRARMLWILLATGLVVWICGTVMSGWEDVLQHVPFDITSRSDFAFFFYGVPVLIALSTPVERQRIPLFSWLDAVQAIFAGYLAYITIFSELPFSRAAIQPIPITLLQLTYNVENAVLAGSCVLRLLATVKGGEEHRFYRTLCLYLAMYGIGVAVFNHVQIVTNGKSSPNAVVDGAFLLLALLIVLLPAAQHDEALTNTRKSPLVLFIDNASPIYFTVALLSLGIIVMRPHFRIGVVAVGVGLACYGIRTTVLQMRYIQAQQELQLARDRLEEISLQDGLTQIANRRCFDQTLEAEWHRAMRTHHPLSLMMIDLDYFKNLNDTYGHPYGDRCLIDVAAALRSAAARSGDLVARYGGEEFAAILPVTSREDAEAIAARMQEAVHALKIRNETQIGGFLTISIGIASYAFPEAGSPAVLIEASDRALYKAKQSGRNRIERVSMQMIGPSFSH